MGYTILLRNGKYALLDMGNQYAVVSGYDPTQPVGQQWDFGTYLNHWNQSAEDKQILRTESKRKRIPITIPIHLPDKIKDEF